jgi:hypothetical protein
MATQPPQSPALPAGLRYYLLRGNIMVPVVPVDQLPFQLQGVPQQLAHRQMSDENWKLLKETEEPVSVLSVQAPATLLSSRSAAATKPYFLAPDHHVRNESVDTASELPCYNRWVASSLMTQPSTGHLRSMNAITLEQPSSLTDSFASIFQKDAQRLGHRMSYPSGIEPDPSKKEFCTHWIKTGECAFISIGCKYKHEMPTADKLRGLGFTQVPKWWKDKSAIAAKGPTWMQRRLASSNEEGEPLDEPLTHRAFPDPSMFRSKYTVERGPLRGSLLHEGSTLKRQIVPEPAEVIFSTRPRAPSQAAISRRDSQISNLLIDIEDVPVPPPSPQLSDSSSNSATFCDRQMPSSCSSELPTTSLVPAPEVTDRKLHVVEHRVQLQTANKAQTAKCSLGRPVARRSSLTSCASDSDEDTKSIEPLIRRKSTPLRANKGANAAQKQTGLASSKYATSNVKNAGCRNRDRNRRTPQKKNTAIEANDLHIEIGQLRRDVHEDGKAKRSITNTEG